MYPKHKCCPTCGQLWPEIRAGVRLPALKARIFDIISRAGEAGIMTTDLHSIVYGSKPAHLRTLRAHIWQINDLLEDTSTMRIANIGRYWFLREVPRRDKHGARPCD